MKTDKHGRKTPNQLALDKPAHRFWDSIERDEIESALQANDKYATFLLALHDPAYSRFTIPAIMHKFNVSLHELQVLYTDHQRQRMLMHLSNGAPQVGIDVVDDAQSKMETCPRCEGEKVIIIKKDKLQEFKRCPQCKGEGEVKVQGSNHSRDLVFTALGIIKQGGPLVNFNQMIVGAESGLDMKMESMMKVVQQITVGGNEEPSI